MIAAGADVNAANDNGVTPLALACENKNDALVERLVTAGANPNAATATGETVLMTAARVGSTAAVTALLDRGANPNAAESLVEPYGRHRRQHRSGRQKRYGRRP